MKYSKNKIYQEKTIKFLKKLENKENSSTSSKDNNSNSFSNSFSDDNNSVSIYSPSKRNSKETSNISAKSSRKLDLLKLFSDCFDNKENSNNKFEQMYKKINIDKKIKKKIKQLENKNSLLVIHCFLEVI